jgi:hypothetical protein
MKTDSLRLCFITTFFTIIIIQCYSQGELPVEMYTGSPIVDFSLGAVKAHDITDPIRLVYKADGIQLSLADVGVTLVGLGAVAVFGTAALPAIAVVGLGYGIWSYAGGSDWIDKNWGFNKNKDFK